MPRPPKRAAPQLQGHAAAAPIKAAAPPAGEAALTIRAGGGVAAPAAVASPPWKRVRFGSPSDIGPSVGGLFSSELGPSPRTPFSDDDSDPWRGARAPAAPAPAPAPAPALAPALAVPVPVPVPGQLPPLDGKEWDEDAACWHLHVVHPHLIEAEIGMCGWVDIPPAPPPARARLGGARSRAVDWIVRVHEVNGLSSKTLFLAVQLLDRFSALQLVRPDEQLLVAAASLFTAAKFEEYQGPELGALAAEGEGSFTAKEVEVMELLLLARLDFRLHTPTAAHHIEWFKALSGHFSGSTFPAFLAQYLCELGLACPGSASWEPSLHAAAAVLLADRLLRRRTPQAVERLCLVGRPGKERALESILQELRKALRKAGPRSAIFQKHSAKERYYIALSAPPLALSSSLLPACSSSCTLA